VPNTRIEDAGALAPEGILSEITKASASDQRAAAAPQVPAAALQVLAADTTVTLDNQILGKPSEPADAARMLRLLSGRTHQVITGIAIVTATSTHVAAETTAVTFIALSDKDIADYIATGEPMDKAGAYAIQGRAARWIPRIEGDYFNVVGLPIALVSSLLDPL
jgi:septum formation protein